MAITHYYIGVGGTGARVAEALIHLCAAGLGPDELFLMLIDPDAGNGNLARTCELISKYQEIQQQIGTRARGVRLFHTRLTTPEPVVWNIFDQQNQTLASFIKLSTMESTASGLRNFAEALFTEQDLDERLNEGFRGRPAIGAVVMSQPNTEVQPWKRFWEEIGKVNRADEAKVLVVGSIFGGTGAAGIPTLGAPAILRDKAALDTEKTRSKIYLGACLVLPYFSFEQEVPPEEKARLFVRPDDFPLATSAALHYYMTKELAYDEMYLLGDSGGQVVGKFGAGASGQRNRAHYVELGAALAALDFFAHGEPMPAREKQYFIAAREGERIGWDGLPTSRDKSRLRRLQNDVKFRLISTTLFFYGLATYGQETLASLSAPGAPPPPTWLKDHFKLKAGEERLDPRSAAQKEVITRLQTFADHYLIWLRDLHLDDTVALLRMGTILESTGQLVPWRVAPVGQLAGDGTSRLLFEVFVNDGLNHEGFLGTHIGAVAADRYLNLFALAADRFAQRHMNVQQPQAAGAE